MKNSFLNSFNNEIKLALLLILSIFLQANFIKPSLIKPISYISPPVEIKYFTAGLTEQFADSFWIRAIQDTDYCEKSIKEEICVGQTWFFNVINLVTELTTNFSEAYYYGGLSLTFFIHDMKGATIIFDKATNLFKYEWPILYLAAYHALFEEKDKLKASRLYLRAAENGAPDWVRLSAGKLASEGGDAEFSQKVLEQLIALESDSRWVDQLQKKLNEVKSKKVK